MQMERTYQGYFQNDGRFVTDNALIRIPTMRRTIIKIMDEEITETKAQKQRKAFEKFIDTISHAEPLSEEFDKSISEGTHLRGEIAL